MRSQPRSGPGVRSLWRAELKRGLELAEAGDTDGARAAFARAHALAPDEAEPAFALGREEQRRGRLSEAERLLRLARLARPAWPLGAAALARVIVARAQPTPRLAIAEARRVLAPARAAAPQNPVLLLVEGELLLEEERADDARRAFVEARDAGADAAAVAAGLARAENLHAIALAASGRADEAIFAFKRAADLDPRWAPPRANLGALWQRLGKPRRALEQYRRALALDPTHGPACFNLGLLLRERGDLDGAARAFAAALTANPPHPDARVELALALCDRGEHARAILLFEEELRWGKSAPATVYTNLGVACLAGGDRARAESAFRQALAHAPEHGPALRNLAHLYAQDGRLVDAAALLARARGNPDAPPASK